MRLLLSALLAFSFAFSPVAQAQVKCQSVLIPATVQIATNWSKLEPEQQFHQLLLMLGSSKVPQVTRKDLIEKGEMSLGVPLSEGKTLTLEYSLDPRSAEPVFRLSRINIVNRFGQKETLSKDPLDPQTGELRELPNRDPDMAAQAADFHFPLAIEGAIYNRLISSSKWLENVTPLELRQYGEGHVFRLKVKGNWRRLKTFVVRDLGKQIFRNLILGGVVFVSGTLAMHTNQPVTAPSARHAKTVEAVVARTQVKALSEVILESRQIEAGEKAWLMAQLAREGSDGQAGNGVSLKEKNIQIRSGDHAEQIWILNRVETDKGVRERIFLTTLMTVTSESGARITTSILIEVPQDKMPKTYETVKKLF